MIIKPTYIDILHFELQCTPPRLRTTQLEPRPRKPHRHLQLRARCSAGSALEHRNREWGIGNQESSIGYLESVILNTESGNLIMII